MWIACTGALLVMAIVIYLAIGRERGGEAGFRFGPPAAPTVASLPATFVAGWPATFVAGWPTTFVAG